LKPLLREIHGITNRFVKGVTKELRPGTSVVILSARSDAKRRQGVVERLRTAQPKILESDLPEELEQDVTRDLATTGSHTAQ
jgi:uncharacterized membrane protein